MSRKAMSQRKNPPSTGAPDADESASVRRPAAGGKLYYSIVTDTLRSLFAAPALMIVLRALAILPCFPMTRPISSGATERWKTMTPSASGSSSTIFIADLSSTRPAAIAYNKSFIVTSKSSRNRGRDEASHLFRSYCIKECLPS